MDGRGLLHFPGRSAVGPFLQESMAYLLCGGDERGVKYFVQRVEKYQNDTMCVPLNAPTWHSYPELILTNINSLASHVVESTQRGFREADAMSKIQVMDRIPPAFLPSCRVRGPSEQQLS